MYPNVGGMLFVATVASVSLWHSSSDPLATAFDARNADEASLQCDLPGGWSTPGGALLNGRLMLDRASLNAAVLLGERHDQLAHHDWQLDTLRALHQRRPDIVLALEMFPRRVQPVLDAWVRGELAEDEFLAQSDWERVWRYDADLYIEIFRYARAHRIPMRALNVEASFTRAVARDGFDATRESVREGVSRPAEPTPEYAQWLEDIYSMHPLPSVHEGRVDTRRAQRNFIEAQLVWDRSMAQGIRDALVQRPGALVVGLIGTGHLIHGFGVPHQLKDLGVNAHVTLLPWDARQGCSELVEGLADAVYNIDTLPAKASERSI